MKGVASMAKFNSVIGHEQIINHLKTAMEQKKVSHAYILNGEKGSGKKMLADIFATALQCDEQTAEPCEKCKSCVQASSHNHPDIIYVTHEKASIGVEDIRTQLNNNIGIKPYSSPYKIYIVPEADKMTEQAQNALLKTIEEPPAYGIILLLTENNEKLLPTILSRCVILNLKAIQPKLIKEFLMKNQKVPEYMAELSANFSQGNVGKAIRYASSEDFIQMKEDALHLLRHIDDMKIYEVIDTVKAMTKYKLDISDFIDLMLLWYRDVLMLKVTANPNVLLYSHELKYITRQSINKDYEGIENIIAALDKVKIRLAANVNFDTAMELMLLTLKENRNDS